MKINEKDLADLALGHIRAGAPPTLPVTKEGWLYKRGKLNRTFKKRWCILRGNIFFYYEKYPNPNSDSHTPIGFIVLEGCRVEMATIETELHAFQIIFSAAYSESSSSSNGSSKYTPGRIYVLGSHEQEVVEDWMKAVHRSSHEYMRAVVAALEISRDELRASAKANEELLRSLSLEDGAKSETVFISDTEPPIRPNRSVTRLASNSNKRTGVMNVSTNGRSTFAELHEQYGAQYKGYFWEKSRHPVVEDEKLIDL